MIHAESKQLVVFVDLKFERPRATAKDKLFGAPCYRNLGIPGIVSSWYRKSSVGLIVYGFDGKPNFLCRYRDFREMSLIAS